MKKNARIVIAGNNDLLGRSLLRKLKQEGFTNLIAVPSGMDLASQEQVRLFFKKEKPEYCFLTHPKEGGIEANITYPAELIYHNLVVQTNIIHAAWQAKVKRLIFFASSCVYPRDCPQPMKEEYLLSGGLEPTNEPYALAKISGIKMCQAYNKQFGTSFISVIPATIFGPQDNFDLENAHVISALIRRFSEARLQNRKKVTLWGTGKPRREFIYADDLADAAVFLMRKDTAPDLVNAGSGAEISIKELAGLIREIVGFKGRVEFDSSRPDGVSRKLLDSSRLCSLAWKPKTELKRAIETVCRQYLNKSKDE